MFVKINMKAYENNRLIGGCPCKSDKPCPCPDAIEELKRIGKCYCGMMIKVGEENVKS